MQAQVDNLAILSGAIASTEKGRHDLAPLKLFSLFEPSESLLHCGGWHSAVVSRRVLVLFGYAVKAIRLQRQQYAGHQGGQPVKEIIQSC
ncbi:hypothetical protein VB757_18535 [Synechococcus sp. BA-132 BA5]|nr:hypothetical protein [Synechococcus sp. BA-132 BA5]